MEDVLTTILYIVIGVAVWLLSVIDSEARRRFLRSEGFKSLCDDMNKHIRRNKCRR